MLKANFLFETIKVNRIIQLVYRIVLFVAASIGAFLLHGILAKTEFDMVPEQILIVGSVVAIAVGLIGYITKVVQKSLPIIGVILSAVISTYLGYLFISFSGINGHVKKTELLFALAITVILLFVCFNTVLACYFSVVADYKDKTVTNILNKDRFKQSFILSGTLFFITIIFLPAQMFFGSYSDFHFPYQLIIKASIGSFIFAFVVVGVSIALANKKKAFAIIHNLIAALVIGVYVQYMFLNATIGSISGQNYNWKNNILVSIIDIILWGAIIAFLVFVALKNTKSVKYVSYIVLFLGLIQLVTYGTLLISADKRCFDYSAVYYDFGKQYVVGDENIIVFIIDAADNTYAKELYDENAEILDEYKDFTLYTDTCSVYDYTNRSLLQMVTNFPYDNTKNNYETRELAWNLESVQEFFDRFHANNYEINFYNFDNENTTGVVGKIDNARVFDPKTEKMEYVSYKTISAEMNKLSMFTYLPNILKSYVDVQKITFEYAVYYKSDKGNYDNKDFADDLYLELDNSSKYVIYQHLYGCHEPNDNIETAEYCMEIIGEYMRQLKELGVYDNSTIIVTADHGYHDDKDKKGTAMRASTPMFMIKLKNQTQDNVTLNNAPIYHTDIMPTIVWAAGLYNADTDRDLFGKTIFDYKDGDSRERIWYDRVYDANYPDIGSYNTYYGFTYIGDTSEFERVVDSRENCVVYPINKYND